MSGDSPQPLAFADRPVELDEDVQLAVRESGLTEEDRRTVREAVENGTPVALFRPDAQDLREVRSAAGLGDVAVPEVDLYAIGPGRIAEVAELAVAPPAAAPHAIVIEQTGSEENGIRSTMREIPAEDADVESHDERLVRTLSSWLDEPPEPSEPSPLERAPLRRSGFGLAAAPEPLKNLEEIVRATELRNVFYFRRNVHALSTYVWGVHNAELSEDWFFVRQQGTFSASEEMLPDGDDNRADAMNRGRFTDLYEIDTRVPGWEREPDLHLELSSPITTERQTKVTSTVNWTLNGKLSGNVKAAEKPEAGAGAEIGGSVGVSSSVSYDINDVTILNLSGTSLNNAAWRFAIAWPYWKDGLGCLGFEGLGYLPGVAKGTFQPAMQWIWRARSQVRERHPEGLPIRIGFKTQVRHIYLGPGCSFNLTNWSHASDFRPVDAVVPWPAKGA